MADRPYHDKPAGYYHLLTDEDALRDLLRTCRARGSKNARPAAQARWTRYAHAIESAIHLLHIDDPVTRAKSRWHERVRRQKPLGESLFGSTPDGGHDASCACRGCVV